VKTIRSEDHRLRLIQFMVCSFFALGIGRLIGFEETPTIAISAILSLYVDRGHVGTIRYSLKRIAAQIVMGGLALAAYLPLCKVIPPWSAMVLSIFFSFCVGLSINERFPFSPLTVSAGDAALIMATGYYAFDPNYYWQRILFCVIGGFIGFCVYYLSHALQARLPRVERQLQLATRQLLDESAVQSPGNAALVSAWADGQLKLWKEDETRLASLLHEDGRTASCLRCLQQGLHWLVQAKSREADIKVSAYAPLYNFVRRQHLRALDGEEIAPLQVDDLTIQSAQDMEIMCVLLPYLQAVEQLRQNTENRWACGC